MKNDIETIWKLLSGINDPEVPVLSITDLGIVRDVKINDNKPEIIITPTYSGCPAMDMIGMQIKTMLTKHGYKNHKITTVLSPAWTTDWMSEEGRQKLKSYGIAPPNPGHSVCSTELFQKEEAVQCPKCNSFHTRMISQFGSTACKAFYQCNECHEPFDYFKCH